MCGFVGMVSNAESVCPATVMRMTDVIQYRGPDDQYFAAFQHETGYIRGFQKGADVSHIPPCSGILGFNRLSIRDTSINGRQPMIDNERNVLVLFNGEIYNSDILKKAFSFQSWRSTTDTEVILALYNKLGMSEMLSQLNGMFAIVVVDLRKKKLFLARDRVGIKPLYYFKDSSKMMFASEIKCFLFNPQFPRKININALHEFFTFGDAAAGTLMEGVCEVPPGKYVTASLEDLSIRKNTFFDLNHYVRPIYSSQSEPEMLEALDTVLRDCVQRQMVSDVAVGCQLSGGVDSSLVAYYARNNLNGSLKDSISIIPAKEEYSEEPYIRYLNQRMNINGHLIPLDAGFIVSHFEKAVWHFESIITYHNLIALLLLSAEAKRYVTVLLSGEGADELWGGYTWFADGYYASKYLEIKQKIGIEWPGLEEQIRGLKGANTYGEFAIMASDTIPEKIASRLLLTDYKRRNIVEERLAFFNHFTGSDFDKHVKYEMSTRLVALLMRQDRTAMANCIENRVPLLDNALIDFAFSLPEDSLLHSGETITGKYMLKKKCEMLFGKQFAFRRKVGFPLPFHEYMCHRDFKALVYEKLLPRIRERGIMDGNYIQKMYEGVDLSRNRWEFAPLWKAFSFEVWCEKFLDDIYV